MSLLLTVDRMDALDELASGQIKQLGLAVYPPEQRATMPGMQREWSSAQWCVRGFLDEELVSFVGLVVRGAELDDQPATIGGIGGVKTHPQFRGRGYAELCMQRAAEFLESYPVDFGLLVCVSQLVPYYGKFGWQPFNGTMFCTQFGEPEEFSFNQVMVLSGRNTTPLTGKLDLHGPPW